MAHWSNLIDTSLYLGVSKETMYRLVTSKKIPCHRLGKLWLFDLEEVDRAIRSGALNVQRAAPDKKEKPGKKKNNNAAGRKKK